MAKKNKVNLRKGEKRYTIQEVFNVIGEKNLMLSNDKGKRNQEDIEVDGYIVHPVSLRYMTFYQKGTVCCKCGRKGLYFTLDKESRNYEGNRRHFNLWSEDDILMTRDHIYPKSKGGKDSVSNSQTMCTICNKLKDSRIEYKNGEPLGKKKGEN